MIKQTQEKLSMSGLSPLASNIIGKTSIPDHLIMRKVLMMRSKERKCYMHLKFHIYPPYIVKVIIK